MSHLESCVFPLDACTAFIVWAILNHSNHASKAWIWIIPYNQTYRYNRKTTCHTGPHRILQMVSNMCVAPLADFVVGIAWAGRCTSSSKKIYLIIVTKTVLQTKRPPQSCMAIWWWGNVLRCGSHYNLFITILILCGCRCLYGRWQMIPWASSKPNYDHSHITKRERNGMIAAAALMVPSSTVV